MKNKIFFVSILFIVVTSGKAFSTAQMADHLIYKGETLPIFTNPLESFFSDKNPRPSNTFHFLCTACWRGYIATWKIEDNKLYLIKIVEGTCSSDAPEIDVSKIFKGKKLPVEAYWYSGILRIPRGKMLSYVHMGYGSVYEKELILTIENGKLVKEETIDNIKKNIPSEEKRTNEELEKLGEWELKNLNNK